MDRGIRMGREEEEWIGEEEWTGERGIDRRGMDGG